MKRKKRHARGNPREGKIRVRENPRRVRSNTGEPDQNYDHAFFNEIVRQLARAGFKGATHHQFDLYQGVYLNVPGVDKFWIVDSFVRGTSDRESGVKWRAAQLVDRDGSIFSATRGDYFMKPPDFVFEDFTLRLQGFDGKWKDIDNPTVGDLPDLLEVQRSIALKKGTKIDITTFQGEHSEDKIEVSQTESGKVDASELVEFCRGVVGGSRVGHPRPRRQARGNPLSGRHIGSQYRETLAQAGYRVHERLNHQEVILEEISSGKFELWVLSDDHSGWVIEIDGKGYEFVRDYHPARSNPITVGPGPEGRSVWQQWKRRMRGASSSDLSDAYVWFMELYDAGRTGKGMPYSSSPQGADEHAAFYAGRDDMKAGQFSSTTARGNPDEFADYDASDREILTDVKEAFDEFELDLLATKKQDPGAFRKGFTVTHGYVPAWRDLLSAELDDRTSGLSSKVLEEGILHEMFDETCNRLGEKGIIIWDDEGDGTVLWAGTEEAYKKYSGE
jgi:hypothetical protein